MGFSWCGTAAANIKSSTFMGIPQYLDIIYPHKI